MLHRFALLFILISFLPCQMSAADYYVSPTGSDANIGSLSAPWGTINFACSNRLPGDNIYLLAGTYTEKFSVSSSGILNLPIRIQNYNGAIVEIRGGTITTQDAICEIVNQHYIVVQGIHFKDNEMLDAQGILVSGNSDGIEIRDCKFSNINFSTNPNELATATKNAQPVIVYGTNGSDPISDLIIHGNEVFDNRPGYSESLAVNGNVDGFEITENIVHDNENIGIDVIGHEGTSSADDQARNGLIARNEVYNCLSPYALSAGIYVDGGKDLIIERNRVYGNQWGIEIGCENVGTTTSNVVVRNNLVYLNEDSGLSLGGFDYPSGSGKVIDCIIRNNTFYGNDSNAAGLGNTATETFLTYTENCQIKNNIFYVDNLYDLMLYEDNVNSLNLSLDYNLYFSSQGAGNFEFTYAGAYYYGLTPFVAGTGFEMNGIEADPLFTSAPNDLSIHNSSPAIDAADNSTVLASDELDFLGNVRTNGGLDIGAIEFGSSPPIVGLEYDVSLTDICIFPNPSNQYVFIEGDLTDVSIDIVDISGAVYQSLTSQNTTLTIDISSFPAGTYWLVIQNNSFPDVSTEVIIKE